MLKDAIQLLHDTDGKFSAHVARAVKSGYLLETEDEAFNGVRIFLPHSKSRWGKLSAESLEKFSASVITFQPERRQVIASAIDGLKSLHETIKREFMETLSEGQIIQGEVKSINEFGVFVDIGPMDALLHASDVNEEYKTGSTVELVVTFVDFRRNRVSLGEREEGYDE